MTLSAQDAQSIAGLAGRLQVDPRTLGGLFELESGTNPNIWGGDGGQYVGLIQFGPGARKEVGLPAGPMTIAEQIPYVEKYFQQRGFKPGVHGPTELYRTVLVGNPNQSGTDSNGTNSDSAAKRMLPGGDLYRRFAAKFDPVAGQIGSVGGSRIGGFDALLLDGEEARPSTGVAAPVRARDPLAAAAALSVLAPLRMAGGDEFTAALAGMDAAAALFGKRPAEPAAAPASAMNTVEPSTELASASLRPIEYLTGDLGHKGYDPKHGASNYHDHLAFATTEERDAAMARLRAAGIQIGSVNDGKHAPDSYHYQNLAFDVPGGQVPVGQERDLSRRVRAALNMA